MLRNVLFVILLFPLAAFSNELQNHPSPYLALHADDPVDWRTWSQRTVALAKKENKLIFISVGYFACHWCHVMQRESFSDTAVAASLNKRFLSVKVDRELNPELDDRLMTFLQATAGRGGWPMNIILTPEGYPIVGFTYLPTEQFMSTLDQIASKWSEDQKELSDAARKVDTLIAVQLNNAEMVQDDLVISDLASSFLDTAMTYADKLGGGFGETAKFPSVPQLLAMLNINQHLNRPDVDEFIQLTLDKMIYAGLYDVIGSGFFRYTVDPDWETPHFEKMLYTNSQLVNLYQQAASHYKREDYRIIARQTLDFMIADMMAENGAFITSLSAIDNHDVEGGYYLWQQDELKKILTEEELTLANTSWGMDADATFEAGRLPVKAKSKDEDKTGSKLSVLKSSLEKYRLETRRLPRDSKQLASLNGYALAVLSDFVGQAPHYDTAAQNIASYLHRLWSNGQLEKALDQNGNSMGAGSLADYSAVALGLLKWSNVAGDKKSAAMGREVLEVAWKKFFREKGWQPLETSLLPNPLYQKHIQDSPEPSAEVVLLQATELLLAKEKNQLLRKQFEQNLGRVTQGMLDSPFYHASLIDFAVKIEKSGKKD